MVTFHVAIQDIENSSLATRQVAHKEVEKAQHVAHKEWTRSIKKYKESS